VDLPQGHRVVERELLAGGLAYRLDLGLGSPAAF
jgi:hypothetical protein